MARDVGAAGKPPADAVMSAVRGAEDAQALISEVQRGCAAPDALHEAVRAVVGASDPVRLRAFARRVQKALEHGS